MFIVLEWECSKLLLQKYDMIGRSFRMWQVYCVCKRVVSLKMRQSFYKSEKSALCYTAEFYALQKEDERKLLASGITMQLMICGKH